MKYMIWLMLFFSTLVAGAANLNSLSIVQNGKFTQLLPELTGIEDESGLFGSAVAVDTEHMIVSAPGAFRGAAAVYRKSGGQWELTQLMDSHQFGEFVAFAQAVDISEDNLVISASSQQSSAKVLMFKLINDSWELSRTLSTPQSNGLNGVIQKVVLKNDTLVVAKSFGINNPSMVYIYTNDDGEWQLIKTIGDMDLDGQTGVSGFNIDFDDNHMIISRSNGNTYSLIRVYDLADTNLDTYQVLEPENHSEYFGSQIALDGNRLVVADENFNSRTGVVYFYQKTNGMWQLAQTINGPEQDWDKNFGSSVQLSGDGLLIGSYGDDETDTAAGAVFYYQSVNNQWVEQQKLLASDGAEFDYFGNGAFLDSGVLIISATLADTPVKNAGKIYSFNLANGSWIEQQIITPKVPTNNSIFSNGLAQNEKWVVVGADGDSDFGEESGAVYLYSKSHGSLSFVEKIFTQEPQSNQQFGKNIVIEDDVMLISATGNTEIDGYVYYYKLESNQWVYQSKFNASDTLPADYFGYGLSLDGDLLAVSALYHEDGSNVGAVYLFALQDNQWTEQQKLSFSSDENVGGIGFDLSLSGSHLAVGTFLAGKAFVFEISTEGWRQVHELIPPESESFFAFGRSLVLANNQLIVSQGIQSPLIYTLSDNDISAPVSLIEPQDLNGQVFRDIDANNDWLVSTFRDNFGITDARVYQFKENVWQFKHFLAKPIAGTAYWNDINIFGNEVLIGDFNNSQRGESNGAAYWVQDLANANFKLNQGLNGNWYNTETSGQGLFIDVIDNLDFSFLGLFTFDTELSSDDSIGQVGAEGQRWLVGQGEIDQANLTINYQLYYAYDGLFDNPREVLTSEVDSYGSLSIKFENCTKAQVSYEIFNTDLANSYPIQRPVAESGDLCDYFSSEINSENESDDDFDYRLNGSWYNPETSGQGLFIDKFKGTDTAFMGWFTFDTTIPEADVDSKVGTNGQRWLVGTGKVNPTDSNVIDYQLYYTYGGLFDDPLQPDVIDPNSYGSLRIEFTDCANAEVEYNIDSENLSGAYSIVKIGADPELCQ